MVRMRRSMTKQKRLDTSCTEAFLMQRIALCPREDLNLHDLAITTT